MKCCGFGTYSLAIRIITESEILSRAKISMHPLDYAVKFYLYYVCKLLQYILYTRINDKVRFTARQL